MRVSGIAFAVLVATAPLTALAAGSDDASALIVADPLPGYTHDETSTLDGPIDLETLLELEGIDPAKFGDLLSEYTGEARTWRSADGLVAVAFVINTGGEDSAARFLHGALDAQDKSNSVAFDSGLPGSAGFAQSQDDLTVSMVIWRQGAYFVEVFTASPPESAASAEDVAKTLASSQAAFLGAAIGAEPSIDVSRVTQNDEETSAAYRSGQVIGTALLIAIPILVIARIRRRNADRRAHDAIFALPPPVFPVRAPLPPPLPTDQRV